MEEKIPNQSSVSHGRERSWEQMTNDAEKFKEAKKKFKEALSEMYEIYSSGMNKNLGEKSEIELAISNAKEDTSGFDEALKYVLDGVAGTGGEWEKSLPKIFNRIKEWKGGKEKAIHDTLSKLVEYAGVDGAIMLHDPEKVLRKADAVGNIPFWTEIVDEINKKIEQETKKRLLAGPGAAKESTADAMVHGMISTVKEEIISKIKNI